MKDAYEKTPWKDVDSYFNFCVSHGVYGADAIKEYKRLAKLTRIPEPKIVRKKK